MLQKGSSVIDIWRTMTEDGFTISTTGVEVIGIETKDGMSEDPHHLQFKFSASNKQVHMSESTKSNMSPVGNMPFRVKYYLVIKLSIIMMVKTVSVVLMI